MEQSLRERMESVLNRITERINQLNIHLEEYKKVENWSGADKCFTKINTLLLIAEELRKELLH